MIEEVNRILQNTFRWPEDCGPHPDPVQVSLNNGVTPFNIANQLDSYVMSVAANSEAPYGYVPQGQLGAYMWIRFRMFQKGIHYWHLNTSIALGLQTELPEDKVPEAISVEDWFRNQENLRNRLGYKLCSKEEFDKRVIASTKIPAAWQFSNLSLLYQLAVREGLIPTGLSGFEQVYVQTLNPERYYGFTAQQFLDNARCDDKHSPRKWAQGGIRNPNFKGF